MAKQQRAAGEFGHMLAAQMNWPRIVIAFDPYPTPPCLKPRYP